MSGRHVQLVLTSPWLVLSQGSLVVVKRGLTSERPEIEREREHNVVPHTAAEPEDLRGVVDSGFARDGLHMSCAKHVVQLTSSLA